jgi:hypothetical protein
MEYQLRKYFYIDFRYCQTLVDVSVRFDNTSDIFGIDNGLNCVNPWTPVVSDIPNGAIVRVWQIQGYSFGETNCFPDYWENALAGIPSVNNHPLLVWGPFPEVADITYYEVWRKQSSGSWQLIDYVDNDVYLYEDNDLQLGNYHTYYYKIRASREGYPETTNFTNEVSFNTGAAQGKINSTEYPGFSFSLEQNYPNPFNPSTSIDYSISKLTSVDLRVYSSMGEEVAVLVNEQKAPGKYSAQFNASNLSSGVYFYKLTAGDQTLVKHMVLLK